MHRVRSSVSRDSGCCTRECCKDQGMYALKTSCASRWKDSKTGNNICSTYVQHPGVRRPVFHDKDFTAVQSTDGYSGPLCLRRRMPSMPGLFSFQAILRGKEHRNAPNFESISFLVSVLQWNMSAPYNFHRFGRLKIRIVSTCISSHSASK